MKQIAIKDVFGKTTAVWQKTMNEQRAFTVVVTGNVWFVENKTLVAIFDTKEAADAYVSQFPASIGGGMHVAEIQVLGLAKPIGELK